MKLVCLQEHFKKALNINERIVGRSLTLPILNNVLLKTEKGKLKISSTNLEMGINSWIPAKVDKEGMTTLPVKILSSFINGLPAKKISLELKDNLLTLKCENYKAEIKCQNPKDFPIIPKIEGEVIENFPISEFSLGLNQVVNTTAQSESKPEFTGVLFQFNKNVLKLVSTDSFRLAEKTINLTNQKIISLIIPQKTTQELIRIFQEKSNEKTEFKMILGTNQILFDFEDIQLISRLIDGQYPDYQTIIPKKFTIQLTVIKKELEEAVRIAGFFSSKISDVKFIINPQKNTLRLLAQNTDVGLNESQINAEIKTEDKAIKELGVVFNYRYIIDGLNNIGDQKVSLGFNNESSPLCVKGSRDTNYLYIIMPLRVG